MNHADHVLHLSQKDLYTSGVEKSASYPSVEYDVQAFQRRGEDLVHTE